LLMYRGTVVLDESGGALVSLPDYATSIAINLGYYLTAVGGPAPLLHVAEKESKGTFRIAGGTPGLEVCWIVTGARHDAWVERYGAPVEMMKPPSVQGRYLHPELYNAGQDRAVHRRTKAIRTPATLPENPGLAGPAIAEGSERP
ncbi:MAG: hypothetical protein PSX37_09480, partial [bacterium]|nr:hypothetical protein [bacterium]